MADNPRKITPSAPFVYLASDSTKKPVDLDAQKMGTALVYVTPLGQEVPFRAGTKFTNSAADRAAAVAKDRAENKPK